MYASLDLITLMQRFNIQRTYAKAAQKDPELAIKVLNPDAIPNLGQVSYCFIDKTGTLTTGDFQVKNVITTSKSYRVDTESTYVPIKTL